MGKLQILLYKGLIFKHLTPTLNSPNWHGGGGGCWVNQNQSLYIITITQLQWSSVITFQSTLFHRETHVENPPVPENNCECQCQVGYEYYKLWLLKLNLSHTITMSTSGCLFTLPTIAFYLLNCDVKSVVCCTKFKLPADRCLPNFLTSSQRKL